MSNTHLHKAKKAKNDCFYTRREDVEKELKHYEDQLEGKWIYMPFDTAKSAFWQYFKDNFHRLKLKHITATSWYQDNPDRRREGIATALMKKAEEVTKDNGFDEVQLKVQIDHIFQYEWYKRLGYKVVIEDDGYYYMRKML